MAEVSSLPESPQAKHQHECSVCGRHGPLCVCHLCTCGGHLCRPVYQPPPRVAQDPMLSTSQLTYTAKRVPVEPATPARPLIPREHTRLEGMSTTHMHYPPPALQHQALQPAPPPQTFVSRSTGKFSGTSHYKEFFPPKPIAPSTPELLMSAKVPYRVPSQPFQGVSTTHSDYRPFPAPANTLNMSSTQPFASTIRSSAKFHGTTTHKEHFTPKQAEIQVPVPSTRPYSAVPSRRFEGFSHNATVHGLESSFKPSGTLQKVERLPPHRPTSAVFRGSTETHDAYLPHKILPCPAGVQLGYLRASMSTAGRPQ